MGDRANIAVLQGDGSAVVLYTHSGGYNLPEKLHTAIGRRARWNNTQYLSRIIFDSMSESCQGEETGFGITTKVWDNSYPILTVDPEKNVIYTADEKDSAFGKPLGQVFTFESFVALESPTWESFD